MSKTFAQAPKPKPLTAEAIAAFERGGPGQDRPSRSPVKPGKGEAVAQSPVPTNVGSNKAAETAKEESVARLSIDLPKTLHRRFKTACAKADLKMATEVTALIEHRTAELEQDLA
ncbi:MAG TPA: hypothetical protein VE986_01720 [Hyphomicrobiales bacterium]|nr:hypothetical protein [Hyphomicrobiales bacterium]